MPSRSSAPAPRRIAGTGARHEVERRTTRQNIVLALAVALIGLLGGLAGSLIGVYTGNKQIDAQQEQFREQVKVDRAEAQLGFDENQRAALRELRREAYEHWVAQVDAFIAAADKASALIVSPLPAENVSEFHELINQADLEYNRFIHLADQVYLSGNEALLEPVNQYFEDARDILGALFALDRKLARKPAMSVFTYNVFLHDFSYAEHDASESEVAILKIMRKDLGTDQEITPSTSP